MNKLKIPENSPLYVLKNNCPDTKESKKSMLDLAIEKKLITNQDRILLKRFIQGEKMDSEEVDELVQLHNKLNIPGIGSLFEYEGGLEGEEFLNIYTLYKMGKYPKSFSNFDRLAISLASRRDTKLYNHLQRCKHFKDRILESAHWFCKREDIDAIQWMYDMRGYLFNCSDLIHNACKTDNVELVKCILSSTHQDEIKDFEIDDFFGHVCRGRKVNLIEYFAENYDVDMEGEFEEAINDDNSVTLEVLYQLKQSLLTFPLLKKCLQNEYSDVQKWAKEKVEGLKIGEWNYKNDF